MIISPLQQPYRITQKFGERPAFYKKFGLKGHDGIDFASDFPGKKVPCYACYDAEVIFAGFSIHGFGNCVILKTDRNGSGNTRELLYAHLDSFNVKTGDRVYLGDKIGIIGNTGNSSGVHLHLALRNRNEKGLVVNYNNGYRGRFDFEKWILSWNTNK